jgi:tetratricopeptide (TPR) repeat protein
MSQSSNPGGGTTTSGGAPPQNQGGNAGIQLQGGAAILAPITAFPNGVPSNALVLIPLAPNGAPIEKEIVKGPVALTNDEVWKLLGFNGPAVQVQDENGRPIVIGLEDLLNGLEKHWRENPNADDPMPARIFAQKLIEHGRHAKAETVLAKLVAQGGEGEDWLALGVTQLQQAKLDKAEATLKGAQNLMKDSPFPALQMAKVAHEKKDPKAEREAIERAIQIDANSVDAWAYLTNFLREQLGDVDKATKEVEQLANAPVNAKTAAPYIALQGFFASDDATRDKAVGFAKKATDRAPDDPLALLCLSALYGQSGKLDEVVKLLAPHEAKMQRDVRLAHNYFEALFQMRDMQKVTGLLNKLATSPSREVKQFAIERSRAIQQMLQQQQQALPAQR